MISINEMISIILMAVGFVVLAGIYLAGRFKEGWRPAEAARGQGEKLLAYFYPAGYLLWRWYEKMSGRRIKQPGKEVREKMSRLLVRDDVEAEYRAFQIKRFTGVWLLAVAGLVVGMAVETVQLYQNRQGITALPRPDAGGSIRTFHLDAEGEWEGRMSAKFRITPRVYTGQQTEELFEKTYAQALELLPGKNESLDHVVEALYFLEFGPPGIRVKWTPERWEYIDHAGKVIVEDIPQEGIITYVTLELSYQEQREEYQIPCRLVRPTLSELALQEGELAAFLEERDGEDPYGESVALPEQYNGLPISFYRTDKGRKGLMIGCMGLLAAGLSCYGHIRKLRERDEERNQQMMADYPDILSKLTVLIGAGFTVRGAWERIALNYRRQVENGTGRRRYAYEEMLYACRGMQGGQSELHAYKSFGKRCGLQPYRKLTVLLEQNLKRGGRDLSERLRSETDEAFSARLHQARRDGEKAGTKLMIPMFLMFILVLILIMVPAAMAM